MENSKSNSRQKNAFVLVAVIFLSWLLRYYTSSNMPSKFLNPTPEQFNVLNARTYLENITALGPRITGTENLEIKATRILIDFLLEIQAKAPPHVLIEIEVQHPSSYFYLDFLGGMINVYNNITNVVARLSWNRSSKESHAILINSHYDSISGSSGASDDAVGVACMLETLRALSHGPALQQPIIFLFNGAEESLMQGSHGFITQHKWATDIQYIINLEAMGAGGKEMVFQCNSEWMANFYAKHAPYPNANVLANELFSHLLWRTAATDFRTFLSHGPPDMVGVDSAYTLNGYVYHTSFDKIDVIPDETLHHTGVNLLSLAAALSRNTDHPSRFSSHSQSNPYLPRAVSSTNAIYFDLFGWNVVYTGYYTITLLHTIVFFLGLYTAYRLYISEPRQNSFFAHLLSSLWNEIFCLSLCLLVNVLVSLLLHTFLPMLWYNLGTFMALLIYVPPALLTSAAVKSKYHHLYTQKYGVSNILSMWLFMLGSCISLNLMLGYVACLHIMSISTVYFLGNAIHDYMTHRAPRFGYDRSKLIQSAVFYHYEICQIPILYIWWSVFSPTFTMLIPLMGKTGTIIPSDTLISIVIGIGVLTGWNSLFPYSIRPAKSYKNMWIGYVILIFILGISIRPYSDLHPKRLWIQHVYKESHQSSSDADAGKSSSIHHGLWVSAFDAAGLDPIIPYIKSAYHRNQFFPNVGNLMSVINDNTPWSQFEYSCNGWSGDCYFHYPYSYPVAEVLQDFIFIPLEESSEIIMTPNKLTLDISTILSNPLAYQEIPTTNHYLRTLPKDSRLIKKILSISVSGSSHMTLVVRELAGSHLLRSTFCREGADLPSDDDWHDSSVVNRPDGVYYIQIGFGMCPENICRQQVYFEVCDESKESKLQIAAYSHYMEGKDEMIRKFIKELPDWSQGAEWSQYQSHMIVKYA